MHRIRLHGPWHAKVLDCFESQAGLQDLKVVERPSTIERDRRVKIPSDWSQWLGVPFRGRVAYTRRFGQPTGLATNQRVWLIVEEVDFQGRVFLNDQQLHLMQLGDPPMRIEVSGRLEKSNQLRIEIELPWQVDRGERDDLAGGLIGSVRLEIEEPADN